MANAPKPEGHRLLLRQIAITLAGLAVLALLNYLAG
jgi:hypothetical protein